MTTIRKLSDFPPGSADEVHRLVQAISPFLYGQSPPIVSAALADLLAMLLAGIVSADTKERKAKREEMLARHIALVRSLIPANEQMIWERLAPASRA